MNSTTPDKKSQILGSDNYKNSQKDNQISPRDEIDDCQPVGSANSQIQVKEKKLQKRMHSPQFGGQLTGRSPGLSSVEITLKNQTGLSNLTDEKKNVESKKEIVRSQSREQRKERKTDGLESKKQGVNVSTQNINHQNSLKPKKKKVLAKDDSGQGFDINFRNKIKNREQGKIRINRLHLEEVGEKPFINTQDQKRVKQDNDTTKKTKRKQLSVSQRRSQDQKKQEDLFPENDDNEEFDLHQSLVTLQLYNNGHKGIIRKDSTIFNQNLRSGTAANLKGMTQIDRNIHQENIAKRVQEYAFGSILNNEDASDIAAAGIATQNNDPEQKNDEDDDDQESYLKSVSLDDEDLQNLGNLKMKMTNSINCKIDKLIENVIQEAEEEGDVVDSQQLRNEEYESLGFGLSIWSTDIKCDSKRQFIQAIYKQTTENATNSEAPKNNSNSDQENEFEQISKNIHLETQILEKDRCDNSKNKIGGDLENLLKNNSGYQTYKIQNSLSNTGIPELQDVQNQQYVTTQNSNQYDQQYPIYQHVNATLSGVNQPHGLTSVHSGGVVSGARLAFTGVSTEAYGQEYPDNQSSNYTHHPLSVLGAQQNQNYQPPFNQTTHSQQYNQNSMNAQNRAQHLFINRQINKFMMNPLYKSKQTLNSISMNKFAAIPWRGQSSINQQASMNASTMHNVIEGQRRDSIMNPQDHYQGNMQGGSGIITGEFNLTQQQQTQEFIPKMNQIMINNSTHTPEGGQAGTSYNVQTNNRGNYQQQPIDNQFIKDSQPFYPTNMGRKESKNILTQTFQQRQRVAPIHVPILIPINNKQQKPNHKHSENRINENIIKQNISNDRSIFMNEYFGDEKILQKKIELDIKMKQTTQNLESKLIKAVDDNDDDDNDEDDEESEITIDVISGQDPSEYSTERQEKPESALNKSITINELKNYNQNIDRINFNNLRPTARERKNSDVHENINENKEETKHKKKEEQKKMKTYRQEILQNLQKQLADFKDEMFTGDESQGAARNTSLSPKRSQNDLINQNSASITPFKQKGQTQNPQQYMDKVLNLMTMINEIESLNKEEEIKKRMTQQKAQLKQAREERDEIIYQYKQNQQRQILQQKQYHTKLNELNAQILSRDDIVANLTKQHEYQGIQIFELKQTIDLARQENQELNDQNNQFQEEIQSMYQQSSSREDEKQQFQSTIYNLSNQINNQNQQLDNNNAALQQLNQENQKLAQELESKTEQMASKTNGQEYPNSDGDELSLEDQLENANDQIKDLQEYIKKKGLEDIKNNQLRQEMFQQNEMQHQSKYKELKKSQENMEKEKDKIIQYLTEQITQNDVGSNCKQILPSMDNQSTIEAQSDFTFDENQDYIKAMLCQQCGDKKSIIEKHESKIQYLEKQVLELLQENKKLQNSVVTSQNSSTTKIGQQMKHLTKTSFGSDQRPRAGSSVNTSLGNSLKASQQILLNNYVRQIKEYLDNIDDQESDDISSMKKKLSEIALKQSITLFDEEEDADSSLITPELIKKIMQISLDITFELLDEAQQPEYSLQDHEPQTVFQTVQFGLNFAQLKEIQASGRVERKACHSIIVQIEKLMYDMNSILDQDEICFEASKEQFSKILGTYLQLPHRLKPIFDHSKKIENVLLKSLKSQEEILKQHDL